MLTFITMQGVSAITLADLGSPVKRENSPINSKTPSLAKNIFSPFSLSK